MPRLITVASATLRPELPPESTLGEAYQGVGAGAIRAVWHPRCYVARLTRILRSQSRPSGARLPVPSEPPDPLALFLPSAGVPSASVPIHLRAAPTPH